MIRTAWHYRGTKAFKHWLARNRHHPAVRRLARYAWQVLQGYENASNDFERNGERFLLENVAAHSPAKVLFDVGANSGDWSEMARWLCPEALIHAFEIAPATQHKLRARFASEPAIIVNDFGLNADGETIEIDYYPENDRLSSFVSYPHSGAYERINVACHPGDGYVADRLAEGQVIDLLKIDVEGAEPYVIKGFEQTLKADRVRAIQFEYGRANIVTRFLLSDMYALLESFGFVLGKLYPNYVAFKDYELTDEDFLGPNFVAIHQGQPDMIRALSRR